MIQSFLEYKFEILWIVQWIVEYNDTTANISIPWKNWSHLDYAVTCTVSGIWKTKIYYLISSQLFSFLGMEQTYLNFELIKLFVKKCIPFRYKRFYFPQKIYCQKYTLFDVAHQS